MRRNSDPSRPGVLSRSAVEYPELTHYSFILLVEGSNDEIREMFRGLHPHNRLVAMRRASSLSAPWLGARHLASRVNAALTLTLGIAVPQTSCCAQS
jgi:hypothetical protein